MISEEDFAQLQRQAQAGMQRRVIVASVSKPPRRKYRNQPTGPFDSKGEARWAQLLKLREAAGEITGLVLDKRLLRYAIVVNGIFICYYEADASWREVSTGGLKVADAKSRITRRNRDYVLKIKLMRAANNIIVEELDTEAV